MNQDDDNIRPPDSVIRERLVPAYYEPTYDDYALKKAVELSLKELKMKEEEETLDVICNDLRAQEQKERENKFTHIKTQLKKLILFDVNNIYYYEVILSIINLYEQGLIQHYSVNKKEYTNIIFTLKSIRLPSSEVNELTKLLMVSS